MVTLAMWQILALVGVSSLFTLVGLLWLIAPISAHHENVADDCFGRMVALLAAAALGRLHRDQATLTPSDKGGFARAVMFDRLAIEHLKAAIELAKDGRPMWYEKAYRTLNCGLGQLLAQVLAQADAICRVQEQAPLAFVRDCGLGP